MLLALTDNDGLMDHDSSKGGRIIGGVREVKFHRLGTGERALDVVYDGLNRSLESETFILSANAYLMNDAGQTIRSYSLD